jgi:hypothetical protein
MAPAGQGAYADKRVDVFANIARTADFWRRTTTIYAGYKFAQARGAGLHLRFHPIFPGLLCPGCFPAAPHGRLSRSPTPPAQTCCCGWPARMRSTSRLRCGTATTPGRASRCTTCASTCAASTSRWAHTAARGAVRRATARPPTHAGPPAEPPTRPPRGAAPQAGQFIGARGDFVPEQICRKLCLLHDRVRRWPGAGRGAGRRAGAWQLPLAPAPCMGARAARAAAATTGPTRTCAEPAAEPAAAYPCRCRPCPASAPRR